MGIFFILGYFCCSGAYAPKKKNTANLLQAGETSHLFCLAQHIAITCFCNSWRKMFLNILFFPEQAQGAISRSYWIRAKRVGFLSKYPDVLFEF